MGWANVTLTKNGSQKKSSTTHVVIVPIVYRLITYFFEEKRILKFLKRVSQVFHYNNSILTD